MSSHSKETIPDILLKLSRQIVELRKEIAQLGVRHKRIGRLIDGHLDDIKARSPDVEADQLSLSLINKQKENREGVSQAIVEINNQLQPLLEEHERLEGIHYGSN